MSGSIAEIERSKYESIWSLPSYHIRSHGEMWAEMFGEMAKPLPGETVLDLGCGVGKGGKALKAAYDVEPTYLDIHKANGVSPLIVQPLWQPIEGRWDYGYCCDVMEHLPEQFTMLAVRNILDACREAFFSIAFYQENFQMYVRQPLHMTVRPFVWWRDSLSEVAELIEARDLLEEGIFYARRRNS